MTFEEKLIEFEKNSMDKFTLSPIGQTMLFSDGGDMTRFFKGNLSKIKKQADLGNEVCKKIMIQYNEYLLSINEKKEKSFILRLKEFAQEESLAKFTPNELIKFKNGSYMHNFWAVNKDKIYSLDNEYAKLVIKQYVKKKLNDRVNIRKQQQEQHQCLYLNKNNFINLLNEFLQQDNLNKFNPAANLYFKNCIPMYKWWIEFTKYEDELIEQNPNIQIMISKIDKQYVNYINDVNEKEEQELESRLLEFEKADLSKFCDKSKITFKDGMLMNAWWKQSTDKVYDLPCNISSEILLQYEFYSNLSTVKKHQIYIDYENYIKRLIKNN